MDTGFNESAVGRPGRWPRARGPRRRPRKRDCRRSRRSRAPARAGPPTSGCPPNRGRTRQGRGPSALGRVRDPPGRSWAAQGAQMRRTPPCRGCCRRATSRSRSAPRLPVSHDEVVRRRVRRLAVEEVDRHVERSPPGVHRCHAAPERSPELREHQRRLGRRREVGRHPVGVIGRVLAILVQRRGPWHLLWLRVDLDLAGQAAHGLQDLAGHLGHWSVRHQRDADLASIGVLHERLVGAEVQPGDDRAGTVRRREDVGLPPARTETKGSMLQLRLGRCQLDCQLPKDLRVGVERVAGLAPVFIRQGWPGGRHDQDANAWAPSASPRRDPLRVSVGCASRRAAPARAAMPPRSPPPPPRCSSGYRGS